MIRYCEEEVELNDVGHFRIEIDTEQTTQGSSSLHSREDSHGSFSETEMILEVELMFSDLLNLGGPEKFSLSS
jgi:hypothetical protein